MAWGDRKMGRNRCCGRVLLKHYFKDWNNNISSEDNSLIEGGGFVWFCSEAD